MSQSLRAFRRDIEARAGFRWGRGKTRPPQGEEGMDGAPAGSLPHVVKPRILNVDFDVPAPGL